MTIEKFVVAEDAGRLINPMIVDGQVHGGVAQGIANALLEEIVYDETGNILTTTLADYHAADRARDPADRAASHRDADATRPSRRPRAWARAAPSAHRPRSSMPSTTRCRRSACDRRIPGDAAAHPRGVARCAGERRMSEKARHHAYDQRPRPRAAGRAAPHAGRRDPRGLRPDRHAYRLRARRLRRLHRHRRRRAGALLPDVRGAGRRQADPHRRGARQRRRRCIRCSRPSWTITACNAASARRAS